MKKEKKKKSNTFTNDFWVYLGAFVIIIVFICLFPLWFTSCGLLDFRTTGQIGDTIGGIMGPFVAIAASILTFLAFWVQYKANEQQRKDIALERFESNLFELIHLQQDITNNLLLIKKEGDKYTTEVKGRDIFQHLYEYFNYGEHDCNIIMGVKELMENGNVTDYTKLDELGCLDHYFRHLYRVLKYIDDSELIKDDLKYNYTSLVRANLSQYELIMLFYNCLSSNGVMKFKPLIEKYAIFNNIRYDLLANKEHSKLYSNTAYHNQGY